MRKLCMTVALVLGLCLVAGAQDPAPAEHLKAIGRAADLIPTDPRAAEAALAEFEDNLAIAWRMYIVFTTRPDSPERDKLLDGMAGQVVEAADRKPEFLAPGVRTLKDVIEYVDFAYLDTDVSVRPCLPLWLLRRHPEEVLKGAWVEFNGTGYLSSSRYVRFCCVPEEEDVFKLPAVRAFEAQLELMRGEDLVPMRNSFAVLPFILYNHWKLLVWADPSLVGESDPNIGKFLGFWSDKGLWEKLKMEQYDSLRAQAVEALAARFVEAGTFPPEQAGQVAVRIADRMADETVGHYSKSLLKDADIPWYRYAVTAHDSADGLDAVLPDWQGGLDYMLHVCVLRRQPLEIIERLRAAGATLEADDENETILAVDDAQYLERMLALGADADHVTRFGKSALHYAAQFGFLDSAKVLLAHGADIDRRTTQLYNDLGSGKSGLIFWVANQYSVGGGRTPLMYACEQSSLEMVRLLLKHGATPTFADETLSPEKRAAAWLNRLDKNATMTPAEKETARHLLTGQ